MNIMVSRDVLAVGFTLGKLFIDGEFFCHTCEDADRHLEKAGIKIKGETAIPRGRYKVVVSLSKRFGKRLPELLDVPQFTGVRIHGGNTAADTEGCLLVGKVRIDNGVAQCADVLNNLIARINAAPETWLEIR